MSKKYYENIKYNNDFSYSNIVSNNPLTRYSFYAMDERDKAKSNLEASMFNTLLKTEDNKYKTLLNSQDWVNSTKHNINFQNVLINNLFTFKIGPISAGIMDILVNVSKQIDRNSKFVYKDFKNFSCKVIPQLFS